LIDDLDGVEKIDADQDACDDEGYMAGERCGDDSSDDEEGEDCETDGAVLAESPHGLSPFSSGFGLEFAQ
jgi:hypothetical protein